jgi:hypothetical protein
MIVTEEILKPYRATNGNIRIKPHQYPWVIATSPALPERFFSDTGDVFQSDWPNFEPKQEKLEVVLVLAFTAWAPELYPGREWLALEHQCGGYSNSAVKMIATRLTLRPSVLPTLRSIAREGFAAESGNFSRTSLLASRIASYVQSLARAGLDCECTWRYLTESLYPIDATQANLDRVAEDELDLQSIAKWPYPKARYYSDPAIIFMTQNSD